MKILITGYFFFLASLGFCQLRDKNWCFSDSCGITFSDSSATFSPSVLTGYLSDDWAECNASISDENGNLLFYTNGVYVWDRNNELMPDGTGLYSNISVTQGALIIPKPLDSTHYYIFTLYQHPDYHGLYYSTIDMNLNNGYGDIVPGSKNKKLDTINIAEKLTAVRHANGRDWWVIHQELHTNRYYIYLVSPDTIVLSSVQEIGTSIFHCCDYGETNFSQDGQKLVSAAYPGTINLFDFDRCTGMISNFIDLSDDDEPSTYGDSFSPDGSKLYVSSFKNLYQFDLSAPNILLSKQLIWENPYYDTDVSSGYGLEQHQLGPDGKIYFVLANMTPTIVDTFIDESLCVINKPNELGAACNFVPDQFYLEGKYAGAGLPNSPNYNLGAVLGSNCDTLFNSAQSVERYVEPFLFPNPAKDYIMLHTIKLHSMIKVFNFIGKKVIQVTAENQNMSIDISSLSNGIYIVTIDSLTMGKFIKQ